MKQSSGDSLRRQSTAAQEFCKIHNLKLVETFTDSGVSGYKGKNFSHESALSQFLRLVENGTIQPNSVLILESMDIQILLAQLDATLSPELSEGDSRADFLKKRIGGFKDQTARLKSVLRKHQDASRRKRMLDKQNRQNTKRR